MRGGERVRQRDRKVNTLERLGTNEKDHSGASWLGR